MKKTLEVIAATVVALLLAVVPLQASDPLDQFVIADPSIPECSSGTSNRCEETTTTTCLRYTWVRLDGTISPGGGGVGYTRECQVSQKTVETKYWSR